MAAIQQELTPIDLKSRKPAREPSSFSVIRDFVMFTNEKLPIDGKRYSLDALATAIPHYQNKFFRERWKDR